MENEIVVREIKKLRAQGYDEKTIYAVLKAKYNDYDLNSIRISVDIEEMKAQGYSEKEIDAALKNKYKNIDVKVIKDSINAEKERKLKSMMEKEISYNKDKIKGKSRVPYNTSSKRGMTQEYTKQTIKKTGGVMYIISAFLYLVSSIFVGIGFNKLFVYENSELFDEAKNIDELKNVYVGGDAYNYIINANYANAYFMLGIGIAIIATIFLCTKLFLEQQKSQLLKLQKIREKLDL